jgi:hypothetical protein
MLRPHHRRPAPLEWPYWQWAALRSAGFPVAGLTRLRIVETGTLAERALDGEAQLQQARVRAFEALLATDPVDAAGKRAFARCAHRLRDGLPLTDGDAALGPRVPSLAEVVRLVREQDERLAALRARYDAELPAVRRTLRELVAEDPLRQAILWQSASADDAIARLLAHGVPTVRNKPVRVGERLAAMYLQRYLAKNDSIGFFGPTAFATVGEHPDHLRVTPGPRLEATREVFFEHWAMRKLAERIAQDPEAAPSLCPRVSGQVLVEGTTLHYLGKTSDLPESYARLLGLCDGTRTTAALATQLVDGNEAGFESLAELAEALAELEEARLVDKNPVVHSCTARPDRSLRRAVERFTEPARRRWLDTLDELERLRIGLESARSHAELQAAHQAIDQRFFALTDERASRGGGQVYEARHVAYLDCTRDVHVQVGDALLGRLRPLELVYRTLRQYSTLVWARLAPRMDALFDRLSTGATRVSFSSLVVEAFTREVKAEDFSEPLAQLQALWREALAWHDTDHRVSCTYEELRTRLEPALAARSPGWDLARFHSPDVLVAASDLAAAMRGDYTLVAGEIHLNVLTTLLPVLAKMHPTVEAAQFQAFTEDLPRMLSPTPDIMHRGRQYYDPGASNLWMIGTSDPPPDITPERLIALAALGVERAADGELVVTSRDGRLRLPLRDCIASRPLVPFTAYPLLEGPHLPRVTVDGLVLCRETWTVPVPGVNEASADAFLAVRRWARKHGLPAHFFVKSPRENKPFLFDLDNPFLVENLMHLAEGVETFRVSEMLPDLGEQWLTDAAGNSYVCELRLGVVDPSTLGPT